MNIKNIVALVGVFGCMVTTADTVTNVYNFKASLKVPYLNNGVREYKGQALKGYMYSEYVDDELTKVWIESQNTKTKIVHVTDVTYGFYNLIGKGNKQIERNIPSVYFEAADIDLGDDNNHELITKIQFAGTGTLKTLKSVTTGCGMCGVPYKTTQYCNVLYSMNGYITGVMNCQCPAGEPWWHTLKAGLCGIWYDGNDDFERSHDAAIWGTWSATFNKKLSDTQIK